MKSKTVTQHEHRGRGDDTTITKTTTTTITTTTARVKAATSRARPATQRLGEVGDASDNADADDGTTTRLIPTVRCLLEAAREHFFEVVVDNGVRKLERNAWYSGENGGLCRVFPSSAKGEVR